MGVLQQIIDNCVGGADEDLEMLRACVTELTPDVLPQQQSEEEDEEDDDKAIELPSSEHQKQNEWEGLWIPNNEQSSNNTQQLVDHVNNDYVITRDEDEAAVLLPTDKVDHMASDVSVVTKSSGAILIESPLLTEALHELKEVPISYQSLDKSHDQVDGSHEPSEGSHEPSERSHECIRSVNEPLEVLNKSVDKSHELIQGSHESVDESHDPLDRSQVSVEQSHELEEGSYDQLTSQEQLTELNLESHDLFGGSNDLTEPLFDEETSSAYRHRSLTAASVSNTPYISLASTSGNKDNSFEAIPLTTGSKKKRTKKINKKKKRQQSSSSSSTATPTAPPPDVQPPPPAAAAIQEEQLPIPPVKSKQSHTIVLLSC